MDSTVVEIRTGDVIANLNHDPRCSLWFDHHASNRTDSPFEGAFEIVPSAAGLIHRYYRDRFSRDFGDLAAAADKIDSADLSEEEVLYPGKFPYILLSETISGFKSEDEPYWNLLVDLLAMEEIGAVLSHPEVGERCETAISANRIYKRVLLDHTRLTGRVSVTDLRHLEPAPTGNRFLVFSLFPDTSVHVKIRRDTRDPDRVIVSLGHSIFNRTCRIHLGDLCAKYGGGGHRGAGSCSFPASDAEKNLRTIIDALGSE